MNLAGLNNGGNYTSQGVSGSVSLTTREKKFSQIPPRSYIQAKVVDMGFPWVITKKSGHSFNEANTLLRIRAYIGYSLDKDRDTLSFIDNEFWVKDVDKVRGRHLRKMQSKDKFYTARKRLDGKKTLILGLVISSILIPILAIAGRSSGD